MMRRASLLPDQIFNYFTGKNLPIGVLSANLESVLPNDGGFLVPEAVPIVARRIDLLTALNVRCPESLRYSKETGHEASLLHYAVREGNKEIIRFLLEQNREIIGDLTKVRDGKHGATPLHWAASVEAVEALLDDGCDTDVISESTGETPLQIAIRYERYNVAVTLIEFGCDLNVQSLLNNKQTALHLALENQPNWNMIAVLLAYGADPNLRNANGESVRHCVATRIAINGNYRREETRSLRKILSLIHHVGANRCSLNKTGCAGGCSAAGVFNGDPVDGYTSSDLTSSIASPEIPRAIFDDNNNCQSNSGSKVLCLDGGAMHGILIVALLKQLETVSKKKIKDCFHVVAGTGIGGIIALYLTYLDDGLNQAQKLFYFLRRKVFAGSSTYTAAVIEGYFKRTFGLEATLKNGQVPKVMIIPRYHTDRVLRNYSLPTIIKHQFYICADDEDDDDDVTLVYRAANDTGVADELFRTGTLLIRNNNNPTVDVLIELSELTMRDASFPRKSLFLSIGTTLVPLVDSTTNSNVDSGNCEEVGQNASSKEMEILSTAINRQQSKMTDPQYLVDQARAWCRDCNCTFARLAPMIGTNLSVDSLQFEFVDSDTVTRAMFEIRTWLACNNSTVAKIASAII